MLCDDIVGVTGWILLGFDWGRLRMVPRRTTAMREEDCLRQQQQQVRLPVSSRFAPVSMLYYIIIVHPKSDLPEKLKAVNKAAENYAWVAEDLPNLPVSQNWKFARDATSILPSGLYNFNQGQRQTYRYT